MEKNNTSAPGYFKSKFLYISKIVKSMSCTTNSQNPTSEPLPPPSPSPLPVPAPVEELELMKEPASEPKIIPLKLPESEECEIVVAPEKEEKIHLGEEAVIIQEPIPIEDRV